jgi:exopolyphosphatase/pppGpp-phosphohydrolase
VHAGPVGLDSQWSSSGTSTAGAGIQAVRPQYADIGTSPFANTQDQEVTALISKLKREMEESRVANSQISLERDEAIA